MARPVPDDELDLRGQRFGGPSGSAHELLHSLRIGIWYQADRDRHSGRRHQAEEEGWRRESWLFEHQLPVVHATEPHRLDVVLGRVESDRAGNSSQLTDREEAIPDENTIEAGFDDRPQE